MRVLFLINSFSYAGAEKLVFDLSQAIADRCDFVGVAALYRMNDAAEANMIEQLRQHGIETYILDKTAGKQRLASVRKTASILRKEKVEVLHAHCSVPMLIGKLAGLLTGTPVVCTVHNTRGYSAKRERLTGWMVKAYVSIGLSAETYMKHTLGIPEKKITRIYNAVDARQFQPGQKAEHFWEQWGLRGDMPVAVNVGRAAAQKNQICFLRALNRCQAEGKPVQAVILGSYDPASDTFLEMQAYIAEHRLEPYVRFLGQQSQVPSFLSNADCFVMTSRYEGMSVSFLEAVFCGVPIVVTDMPFVRELNAIAQCATVVPQDDDAALAQVLLRGKYSPPSVQAQRRFAQQFSLETFADAHFSLYCSVTEELR